MSGEEDKEKSGSGQTPSVPELDSIMLVRSPAKPSEDEDADFVYRELWKLLEKPVPSWSKNKILKIQVDLALRWV